MIETEFEGLSAEVVEILAGSESDDVEFKEAVGGVKSSDLVAFANSATGGTMLIGIREIQVEDGRQRGEIIGCKVSDKAKLTILNKAATCVPPIQITIVTENTADVPFFRIEIPTGIDKPYCTGGGTYKIRGNARTNSLTPSQLLALFMESESQRFLQRFSAATKELEADLWALEKSWLGRGNEMTEKLDLIEEQLGRIFGRIQTPPTHKPDLVEDRLAQLEQKVDQILAALGKNPSKP